MGLLHMSFIEESSFLWIFSSLQCRSKGVSRLRRFSLRGQILDARKDPLVLQYSFTAKEEMAKFLGALCLVLALVCYSVAVEEANNSSDPCHHVYCKKGRMCVASEDSSTRCVCPESCPQVVEPVCTFYHKQHNNTCEMHRFACRYGFFTAVKHNGPCTPEEISASESSCPLDRLLDFHDRYLDWLRISYEEANNLKLDLSQEARLESLIDQERKKLIEWEFTSRDTNKNGILDINEMKLMVDEREPCMVALISSCDFDNEPGISQTEWSTCFPLRLEGLENQVAQEIL